MESLYISLMLIIFVIVSVLCIGSIAKRQASFIYANVPSDPEKIEWDIRELIWKNPDKEIILVVFGENYEANLILDRLERDFPQIHIIKNKN